MVQRVSGNCPVKKAATTSSMFPVTHGYTVMSAAVHIDINSREIAPQMSTSTPCWRNVCTRRGGNVAPSGA
jgi:hypothetical protein